VCKNTYLFKIKTHHQPSNNMATATATDTSDAGDTHVVRDNTLNDKKSKSYFFGRLSTLMGIQTYLTKRTRSTQNNGKSNLKHLSTGEPTYWPSNMNKLPDLVHYHKKYSSRLRYSQIMFLSILRSLSCLGHTNNTCKEPRNV
jgi:hypothetical protein